MSSGNGYVSEDYYNVKVGTFLRIYRYGFTAKGSFYAIFETDDSNGVTCEKHLVYDRVSENGKCDLFVYQQEQVGADVKILSFYAVKKGTGQVISADKTAWGGVSSKEYQNATGED